MALLCCSTITLLCFSTAAAQLVEFSYIIQMIPLAILYCTNKNNSKKMQPQQKSSFIHNFHIFRGPRAHGKLGEETLLLTCLLHFARYREKLEFLRHRKIGFLVTSCLSDQHQINVPVSLRNTTIGLQKHKSYCAATSTRTVAAQNMSNATVIKKVVNVGILSTQYPVVLALPCSFWVWFEKLQQLCFNKAYLRMQQVRKIGRYHYRALIANRVSWDYSTCYIYTGKRRVLHSWLCIRCKGGSMVRCPLMKLSSCYCCKYIYCYSYAATTAPTADINGLLQMF